MRIVGVIGERAVPGDSGNKNHVTDFSLQVLAYVAAISFFRQTLPARFSITNFLPDWLQE